MRLTTKGFAYALSVLNDLGILKKLLLSMCLASYTLICS